MDCCGLWRDLQGRGMRMVTFQHPAIHSSISVWHCIQYTHKNMAYCHVKWDVHDLVLTILCTWRYIYQSGATLWGSVYRCTSIPMLKYLLNLHYVCERLYFKVPSKHKTLTHCCLSFGQRHRRWTNIKTTLVQHLVFTAKCDGDRWNRGNIFLNRSPDLAVAFGLKI